MSYVTTIYSQLAYYILTTGMLSYFPINNPSFKTDILNYAKYSKFEGLDVVKKFRLKNDPVTIVTYNSYC